MIVNIRYVKKNGEPGAQTYSYTCDFPVAVGDLVNVPTARGDRVGEIVAVNVAPETVDPQILSRLLAVTGLASEEAQAPEQTTMFDGALEAANEPFGSELIVVRQLPIIEEQLAKLKEDVEAKVADALEMPCTEDTLRDVKAKRAALRKEYAALEQRRKEVKTAILVPYEKFEQVYKACAGDIFSSADNTLAKRIGEVEAGLKSQKAQTVQTYFEEYQMSLGIGNDITSFADAKISVTLSISVKALKAQAKAHLDRVAQDLALIDTQQYSNEILVEYKSCKNAAVAITTVTNRHRAIEEEQRRREALEEAAAAKAAAIAKVKAAAEKVCKTDSHWEENNSATEQNEPDVVMMAPEAVPAPESEPAAGHPTAQVSTAYYSVRFRVTASLEDLKALKKFMNEGGYIYEQL